MQYCIYLRKSRADMEAEAHGEGETLARHERILLELAKRGNYNVTQIYREIVSGDTIAARPMMQRLLQEVESGMWTGVLVVEIERLARGDTVDQGIMAQTFKYSGTKIITPMKVYDPDNEFDEEYFEFGLFMSRREYKTINRRLQRGRDAAAKEGKFLGSVAPYGYEKIRIPGEKGYTLRPVEDKANIVRLIFQFYVHGELRDNGQRKQYGTSSIATKLNNMGIPAPTETADWTEAEVRNLLSNPVYIGKIRYHYNKYRKHMVDGVLTVEHTISAPDEMIYVDGLHPALVSVEDFEKAQSRMQQRTLPPVKNRNSLINPLAGLLVCGFCGRHLVMSQSRKGATVACIKRNCENVGSYYSVVEERLLQALSQWLSDYRLELSQTVPDSEEDLISLKQNAVKKTQNEISKLKGQLSRTHDLLEQGVYDTDMFLRRSRTITERIEAAEESLKSLSVELSEDRQRAENRRSIVPKVEKLLEVYQELPDAKAKNDMLKGVLEKVVYTKKQRGHRNGPLDNFELVIYPKLKRNI